MSNINDFIIENGTLVRYKGTDAEVIIPDGVKVIGRRAFYWNKEITSVIIPASVEEIGQEAFEYCYNLDKATFDGEIKKAGTHAFGWIAGKPQLEIQVYNAVAIRAFSKSAQGDAIKAFCRKFADLDKNTEIFKDNIDFIGTHLKLALDKSKTLTLSWVMENEAVLHAIMEAGTIPAKDAEWVLTQLNPEKDGTIVAEILDYKNKLLADPKKKKALEKAKAKAAEKELSAEMTASDWRKIFKFSYSEGDVVIKETKTSGEILTVPAYIGAKKVRVIDRRALSFTGDKKSPEKIIISQGIEEIKRGAFFCVDDAEVFIPDTVTSLPVAPFIAVSNIILHLPATLTEIPEELEWDSAEPAFKAIYAPEGSVAEAYAKAHNIPFTAE